MRTGVLAGFLLCVTFLAACSLPLGPNSSGDDVDSPGPTLSAQASMEEAIEDATAVRREAQRVLDRRLGPRPWEIVSTGGEVITHYDCDDGEDPMGQTASLPSYGFRGAYPESRWKEASRLVLGVAREHGFASAVVLSDRPGDYVVEAVRDDGAELELGFAANTTLSVTTGCHLWRKRPGPGPIPVDRS